MNKISSSRIFLLTPPNCRFKHSPGRVNREKDRNVQKRRKKSTEMKLKTHLSEMQVKRLIDVEDEREFGNVSPPKTKTNDTHMLKMTLANTLESIPRPEKVTDVIMQLCRNQKINEAKHLLETTTLPLDAVDYNILLNAYAKRGDSMGINELIGQMQTKGIKFRPSTFSTIIETALQKDKLELAFRVLLTMKEQEVSPDVVIFSQLISGCLKANQIERAWKTFDVCRFQFNIEADLVLYTLMIKCCAREKRPERALDLFTEMRDKGILPSETTFGTLLSALSGMKKTGQVYFEQVFAVAQREGIWLDNKTWANAFKVHSLSSNRTIWNYIVKNGNVNVSLGLGLMEGYVQFMQTWFGHVRKQESLTIETISSKTEPMADVDVGSFEEFVYKDECIIPSLPEREVSPPSLEKLTLYKHKWLTSVEREELPRYSSPEWLPPSSTLLEYSKDVPLLTNRLNSPDLVLAECAAFASWLQRHFELTMSQRHWMETLQVNLILRDPLHSLTIVDMYKARRMMGDLHQDFLKRAFDVVCHFPSLFREYGQEIWEQVDRDEKMHYRKIHGHASLGQVEDALLTLEKLGEKGKSVDKKRIGSLVGLCLDLKEDGKREYLNRLHRIVPLQTGGQSKGDIDIEGVLRKRWNLSKRWGYAIPSV
jgi:pentatricopeptide repeat protein